MRYWYDYRLAFTAVETEAWGGKGSDEGHIARKSDRGFKRRQSRSRAWPVLLENAVITEWLGSCHRGACKGSLLHGACNWVWVHWKSNPFSESLFP